MASFKSTYLCNLFLNALFNAASFDDAIPATLYAQLYTAAPTAAGGGTQVAVSGISRAAMTRNTTNMPTATSASINSATALSFGTPASGVTVVGVGWFDASSGGNLLDYGDLDAPKVLLAGVAFSLPAGAFVGTEV